jgi:fructose-1,6-bisphosphatase/inositol monophosphatase family enzyme
MHAGVPDVDKVSDLVLEVARTVVLPRFGGLEPADVERKSSQTDPDDIVTIVDRQVEAALTHALREAAPETAMIGEEAVHGDPRILDRLASDKPVWLLDPIDGTRNFVAGDDGFGIMLAYVSHGVTRAAWVCLPARSEMFVAELGSGVLRNGVPTRIPSESIPNMPRGAFHTRYMPPRVRAATVHSAGRFVAQTDARSAAIEYTDILCGQRDFAIYYRLLPWDHAAPGLIVSEGGGWSGHLDGTPYSPRSSDQMTVVASSRELAEQISNWLRTDLEGEVASRDAG